MLDDGTEIPTRALMIATGARYRSLPLERWDELVGAGIFYAATELEARTCAGDPVTVVGGGNGAGQAALFLASCGCDVTVAIRRPEIESGMSQYLVDRLLASPKVTVTRRHRGHAPRGRTRARVDLACRPCRRADEQACRGLFCFIGAEPATGWLSGVALDEDGFVRTDVQLVSRRARRDLVRAGTRAAPVRDERARRLCRRRRTPWLDEARGRGRWRRGERGSVGAHRDRRPRLIRAG